MAAEGGHREVLVWLREHDCPWDGMTVFIRRCGRAPGRVELGAGARLPVERVERVNSLLRTGT